MQKVYLESHEFAKEGHLVPILGSFNTRIVYTKRLASTLEYSYLKHFGKLNTQSKRQAKRVVLYSARTDSNRVLYLFATRPLTELETLAVQEYFAGDFKITQL